MSVVAARVRTNGEGDDGLGWVRGGFEHVDDLADGVARVLRHGRRLHHSPRVAVHSCRKEEKRPLLWRPCFLRAVLCVLL